MLLNDAAQRQMLRSVGAIEIESDAGEFWALFDDAFLLVDGGSRVETRSPALTVIESDVASIPKGAIVTIKHSARRYRVVRTEPDGEGMAIMVLAKA